MKPKTNRAGDAAVSLEMDRCQTPLYALDPLLPYLPPKCWVWEPAAGDGNIARALHKANHWVVSTDVLTGHNFFTWQPALWTVLVTNPPYSIKYDWLAHCYELGRPFALLLPIDTIGAAKGQCLFRRHGVEIIYLNRRVNFKMPNKGYGGSAQFATAWFTWGLNIGQAITFAEITRCPDEEWTPPTLRPAQPVVMEVTP